LSDKVAHFGWSITNPSTIAFPRRAFSDRGPLALIGGLLPHIYSSWNGHIGRPAGARDTELSGADERGPAVVTMD